MIDPGLEIAPSPPSQAATHLFRHGLIVVAVVGMAVGVWMHPPIPQDPGYHVMAYQRPLLGMHSRVWWWPWSESA